MHISIHSHSLWEICFCSWPMQFPLSLVLLCKGKASTPDRASDQRRRKRPSIRYPSKCGVLFEASEGRSTCRALHVPILPISMRCHSAYSTCEPKSIEPPTAAAKSGGPAAEGDDDPGSLSARALTREGHLHVVHLLFIVISIITDEANRRRHV